MGRGSPLALLMRSWLFSSLGLFDRVLKACHDITVTPAPLSNRAGIWTPFTVTGRTGLGSSTLFPPMMQQEITLRTFCTKVEEHVGSLLTCPLRRFPNHQIRSRGPQRSPTSSS